MYESSHSSISLPTLDIIILFSFNQLGRYIVAFHYGFNLYFPN